MAYRFCFSCLIGFAVLILACAPSERATPKRDLAESQTSVLQIHDIQGGGHRSPFEGQVVSEVLGVVTVEGESSFWMETLGEFRDEDIATSEGLFVVLPNEEWTPSVGSVVKVAGRVEEQTPDRRPDDSSTTRLRATSVSLMRQGHPLPSAVVLGNQGRLPPNKTIDDDGGEIFDPAEEGRDFFESLEGMRVMVMRPRVVGPTTRFGEIVVLCEDGDGEQLSSRGALPVSEGVFHPSRIHLDDALVALPEAKVGDHLGASITGVMDYSFGNPKVFVTETVTVQDGGLQAERAEDRPPGDRVLRVATYNVENLSPASGPETFASLGRQIVEGLGSPDLIGIQEVQDDDGPESSDVVSAEETWGRLVAAVEDAGGPAYRWVDISPEKGRDGGQPGGNIRVGFLWRTDRGLELVERPGGTATAATGGFLQGLLSPPGVSLTLSPGRIAPTSACWEGGRKSLAAEFNFRGWTLVVVVNHWKSKWGDTPLFGAVQPPLQNSRERRFSQAQVVRGFVEDLLGRDPDTSIIVLGDLNDFQFSPPVRLLGQGGLLFDLSEGLLPSERYSYVYEGNAQVLDHIFVTPNLLGAVSGYDVVHLNAEFPHGTSDHDPCLATLVVPSAD